MTILTKENESQSISPSTKEVSPLHLSNEDSSSDNTIDTSFALKPARRHRQFLPECNEYHYESLKGYDHTIQKASTKSEDNNSSPTTEKVSDVKQRGGGSWLLGFARLRDQDVSVTEVVPGLVRSNSSSSLESSATEDDASTTSSSTSTTSKKKGVSFNETVTSLPIPHASEYTLAQRRRMYTSSIEVRKNKIRNKREFRYDGYDWRNCTEEWEMSVCMVTGDLVHPVHAHSI